MVNLMKQIIIKYPAIVAVSLLITGCKTNKALNERTLKSLYNTYKNGEIDECLYNGDTVYTTGLNVYDAAGVVYNKAGDSIANCDYGEAQVDSICTHLKECSVIYRCQNHITGEPFVDKYGLSK